MKSTGQGRVGQHHALDRGVADVPLVPERQVLEGGDRVAAHHPRQARDVLEAPGVALVGHRRGALLALARTPPRPRAPRCAPGGGARPPPGRRSRRAAPGRSTHSAWRSRCTTWVAADSKPMPSRAQTASSTAGSRWAKVPTAPEILPTAACAGGAREALAAAAHRLVEHQQLQAEGGGLGVHAVGAADHRGVAVLLGARAGAPRPAGRRRPAAAPPASRIWSASAVSITSLEVMP